MIYLILSLFATLTLFIIHFRDYISQKFEMYDNPNKRKIHKKKISNIGGFAILTPFIIGLIIDEFLFEKLPTTYIFSLSLLAISVFILGYVDDKKNLRANSKILCLIIIFFLFVPLYQNFIIQEIRLSSLDKILNLGNVGFFFTFCCFFIFFNTLNFIDGTNGLLSSIAIYWLIIIIFKFGNSNIPSLILLVSLIIFFIYNINNKVFLGNSGANVLSIVLSFFTINIYNIDTKIGADEIFFLFLFPGLDSLRVIISRVIKSKNILEPDNSHLHHLMLKKVKHEYVWIIYLILTISIYLVFIFTNNILFSLLFSLLFYYIVFVIFNKKII